LKTQNLLNLGLQTTTQPTIKSESIDDSEEEIVEDDIEGAGDGDEEDFREMLEKNKNELWTD